jgi:phosphoribosyl-AMP cyclohydrolase
LSSSAHDIEEGLAFKPKFDADGLITAVVTDAKSGDVLMVAHMNEEALRRQLRAGGLVLQSVSQGALEKGETSGHVQRVVELR